MKNKIGNYLEWLTLTVEEKNKQINDYWINSPTQVKELQSEILKAFRKKVDKNRKAIERISFGWTGWYSPTIFVVVKENCEVRLPRIFDIFEIKKIASK